MTLAKRQFFSSPSLSAWLTMACVGVVLAGCGEKKADAPPPQGPMPVTVLDSAGQSIRVKGALSAGQEIAVTSMIALKAAWLGKGGSE